GAAGSRQDDAANLPGQATSQTLVNRRVFAVNRQDLDASLASGARNQFTRYNQHLFRGEAHLFAGPDRLVRRLEPRDTMRARNHEIDLWPAYGLLLALDTTHDSQGLTVAQRVDPQAYRLNSFSTGHHRQRRAKLKNLPP